MLKLSGGKCTPLYPYHRLRPCCSYILHTSDQRSHADFPSLPDASSHSSFISLISLSHTFLCCGAMTRMGRPYIISDFWCAYRFMKSEWVWPIKNRQRKSLTALSLLYGHQDMKLCVSLGRDMSLAFVILVDIASKKN